MTKDSSFNVKAMDITSLLTPDCLKTLGASNVGAAITAFQNDPFNFSNLGSAVHLSSGGYDISVGQTSQGITTLNGQINWLAPNSTVGYNQVTGVASVIPVITVLLNALRQDGLNVNSISIAQFQELVVLHELGHVLGGLPNDGGPSATVSSLQNTETVIQHCMPTLLQ